MLELMAQKTSVLLRARTFAAIGMVETAQPLGAAAAAYEEQSAPWLDALGRPLEAAASRISAGSCHQKSGAFPRAVNLYQAALAAPLPPHTRRDVKAMLAGCLKELSRAARTGSSQRGGQVRTGA
jgi:hypothetical protein